MSVPGWWSFLLLGLAAFRLFRLIAMDTILDTPRSWLLRIGKDWVEGRPVPPEFREKWSEFILCPWCLGFWLSGILLVGFCLVTDWLDWFGFFVTWFALSAFVGLIAHFSTEEE